jgi:gas vesicle protein
VHVKVLILRIFSPKINSKIELCGSVTATYPVAVHSYWMTLVAPQTGEKTRKQLKRHLEDASDYIKDTTDDLSKHATRVYKSTIDAAGDVASRVSSVAGNVSSVASNIADKVGDLV